MAIRLPSVISSAKMILKKQSAFTKNQHRTVPKGHVAVYVGDYEVKRHVVPLSYLSHPIFQDLLKYAEEEFGFNHPMGGLTIPCNEERFFDLTNQMSSSRKNRTSLHNFEFELLILS